MTTAPLSLQPRTNQTTMKRINRKIADCLARSRPCLTWGLVVVTLSLTSCAHFRGPRNAAVTTQTGIVTKVSAEFLPTLEASNQSALAGVIEEGLSNDDITLDLDTIRVVYSPAQLELRRVAFDSMTQYLSGLTALANSSKESSGKAAAAAKELATATGTFAGTVQAMRPSSATPASQLQAKRATEQLSAASGLLSSVAEEVGRLVAQKKIDDAVTAGIEGSQPALEALTAAMSLDAKGVEGSATQLARLRFNYAIARTTPAVELGKRIAAIEGAKKLHDLAASKPLTRGVEVIRAGNEVLLGFLDKEQSRENAVDLELQMRSLNARAVGISKQIAQLRSEL